MFSACNTYDDERIISKTKIILDENYRNIVDINKAIEYENLDSCLVYWIMVSSTTDGILFNSYRPGQRNAIVHHRVGSLSISLLEVLRKKIPSDYCSNIWIHPGLMIAYEISTIRNKKFEYVSLVYAWEGDDWRLFNVMTRPTNALLRHDIEVYNEDFSINESNSLYYYGNGFAVGVISKAQLYHSMMDIDCSNNNLSLNEYIIQYIICSSLFV